MFEILYEYYVWYFNKSGLQFIKLKLIHHQLIKTDWKKIQNVILKIVSDSLFFFTGFSF